MENKHIVCELTKIILNDGVTLYPGYCEVKDGVLYRYDSQDPNNMIAKYKPWVLHHRVEYKYIAHQEPLDDKRVEGKYFMSKKALDAYLTTLT